MVHFLDSAEMATLIYGVLDMRRKELTFVNAGHLPPIICRSGSEAVLFELESHPPLGVVTSIRPTSCTIKLGRGDTVLLYSDGIVERRTTPLDERLEMLRELVDCDEQLEAVAERVFKDLCDPTPDDDMALLLVRLSRQLVGPFSTTVDADPKRLSELRTTLRAWLSDLEVPPNRVFDILVAVGEACANSIEHGYGPAGGSLELELAKSDGFLEATIRDHGRWREPRGSHRGRGLGMMRRLATSVDLVRRPDGTEVRLGWNLGEQSGS